MKVNGLEINEMDLACIYDQIKLNTKENEKMIRLTAREPFIIQMETFLKGFDKMIKPMDMAFISI